MKIANANFKYIRTEKFDLNQADFGAMLGIKRGAVGSYEEGRADVQMDVMLKLVKLYNSTFFPKINLDVLVNHDLRQGDLFDTSTNQYTQPGAADLKGKNLDVRTLTISTDEAGKENIEYVDAESAQASAGYLNGYADTEFISSLPKFRLPFLPDNSTYRAFKIKGDSMLPLPSGSIVIGEYTQDWESLKSGDTYIIISQNEGIVYKRVTNLLQKRGVLLLSSDNPTYEPYVINALEIVEVWKAKAFIINDTYIGDSLWEKLFAEIAALRAEVKRLKGNDNYDLPN
ncbi:MAG: helix-turn-helix domain-containing protein [Sphingobacteriales bacterium]|nr:MAG: helix-turn-helix domain-containing protein [Sphingobacteriales bacterium]